MKKKFLITLLATALLMVGTNFAAAQSEDEIVEQGFYVTEITDEIFARIKGKSFKDNCTLPREDLRYLHVLHKNFRGETCEGEIICNAYIVADLLDIFQKLYAAGYQIERIRLVDEYNADDELSMRDNNSSCFNFRFISHTTKISKHGLGLAIDINTLYNPYVKVVDGKRILEPATAEAYVDRTKNFPHKIDRTTFATNFLSRTVSSGAAVGQTPKIISISSCPTILSRNFIRTIAEVI